MQTYRTEGIILQTLNFQDFDQIATVFTPMGLIKLIIKGANHSRRNPSKPSPMALGEFVYTQGKSELFKCLEFSLTKQYSAIRTSLSALEAACDILHAIIESQLPHKPAPDLYHLILWTFGKLPSCIDPHALAVSFRLKILRHDGLIRLHTCCNVCGSRLIRAYVASGETLCQKDAPPHHLLLELNELEVLCSLLDFRVFSEIAGIQISSTLRDKIKRLFSDLLN
jgi:DNA repair protein RecO (recombination protein O)